MPTTKKGNNQFEIIIKIIYLKHPEPDGFAMLISHEMYRPKMFSSTMCLQVQRNHSWILSLKKTAITM